MSTLAIDDVVAALGMPQKEIVHVQDHSDGTIVQTKDGNAYIILSNDKDDDGNAVVKLYVPAHPKVKLPMDTYKPSPAAVGDLGISVAQPVAPEVALALQWRRQQLEQAAEADGVKVADPVIVTDPLADASVKALVTDPGPAAPGDEVVNENPADQKPDEPADPQPAAKVVKAAKKQQAAVVTPPKS
jgi:hypothetical protein